MLSAPELDRTYREFTELADRKKAVYDQDLIALLGDHHDTEILATEIDTYKRLA